MPIWRQPLHPQQLGRRITGGITLLSLVEGLKAGDTLVRNMLAYLSVTEGLKGGDALGKDALMSLLGSDGIKMGEGVFQQSFFPITPLEVTPGIAESWQDVDVSAYVPVGATGVILHCSSTAGEQKLGLRKNGSSDNRIDYLLINSHCWSMIGIDSSRIFEAYISTITDTNIYLVGYTISGVTFFTNAYNKSLSSTGSWIDIDCSSEAPNAIGLIFEVVSGLSAYNFGFRAKGSTDDRHNDTYTHCCFTAVIGCNNSQVCQGWIEDATVKFYLVGYITIGAVFNTNATDLSLTTAGSWLDLSTLPSQSNIAFIEVTSASGYNYGLRKNGSSEDIYYKANFHPWAFVECDSSRIIEGKIENTWVDFFLVGYATKPEQISMLAYPSLTDGVKFSDLEILSGLLYYLALTEGLKLGDTQVRTLLASLSLTEGTKFGDSILAAIAFYRALTEGLKVGDTQLRTMKAYPSLSDGMKFSEAFNLLSTIQLSLTDGTKLGDLAETVAGVYYLSLSEGMNFGESLLRSMLGNLQLSDGTKLGDSLLVSKLVSLGITEGIKLGDTTLRQLIVLLALTEGLKLGDSESRSALMNVTLTDGTKLGDMTLTDQIGQMFKIMVLTAQCRNINVLTSQYRDIDVVAAQKRKIKTITSGG